jgi:hypothetical protein
MTTVTAKVLTAFLQSSDAAPLPAQSPIGGPFWSYVVPALLLAVATMSTYMLYRHFAGKDG